MGQKECTRSGKIPIRSVLSTKKRRAAAATAAVLLILVSAFIVYKVAFDPYRHQPRQLRNTEPLDTPLTSEQIGEDMDYVYKRVSERHPAWLDGSDELVAAFDESYREQCEYLASIDGATVRDEWLATARILASLGDAHTYCNVRPADEPVLELVRTDELSDNAVLVNIGGRSIDPILESYREHCSYENDVWLMSCFENDIVRKPWLDAFGIDTSGEIVFEYSDDRAIKQAVYKFVSVEEYVKNHPQNDSEEKTTPDTEYFIDTEHNVGVLTLHSCVYDKEYEQIVNQFFTEVKENEIGSVAVDLRDNGGGNSQVANEFISYLDTDRFTAFGGTAIRAGSLLINEKSEKFTVVPKSNTFSGDVYVLTSDATFSSALDFAVMIQDNGLGTVIGSQPGGMPSSYGDVVCFRTPNAGVLMQVSFKHFSRVDSTKNDLPLIPDIECDPDDAPAKLYELTAAEQNAA